MKTGLFILSHITCFQSRHIKDKSGFFITQAQKMKKEDRRRHFLTHQTLSASEMTEIDMLGFLQRLTRNLLATGKVLTQ